MRTVAPFASTAVGVMATVLLIATEGDDGVTFNVLIVEPIVIVTGVMVSATIVTD